MSLLPYIPAFHFLSALILVLFGSRLSRKTDMVIGTSAIGLSALATLFVGQQFLSSGQASYRHVAWNWFDTGELSTAFAFHLDALSLVFISVITFVGFLIHVYSIGFMHDDEGATRFFAYLNLFVCAMLLLVLGDNLVLLYLG